MNYSNSRATHNEAAANKTAMEDLLILIKSGSASTDLDKIKLNK